MFSDAHILTSVFAEVSEMVGGNAEYLFAVKLEAENVFFILK